MEVNDEPDVGRVQAMQSVAGGKGATITRIVDSGLVAKSRKLM